MKTKTELLEMAANITATRASLRKQVGDIRYEITERAPYPYCREHGDKLLQMGETEAEAELCVIADINQICWADSAWQKMDDAERAACGMMTAKEKAEGGAHKR